MVIPNRFIVLIPVLVVFIPNRLFSSYSKLPTFASFFCYSVISHYINILNFSMIQMLEWLHDHERLIIFSRTSNDHILSKKKSIYPCLLLSNISLHKYFEFQYYPDARMTPREAKNFFSHIKRSHPELTVTLRSHLNSMGDWMKVKKVFFPRAW